MLMPWKIEKATVELLETADAKHGAGLLVELDKDGELPTVIIFGTWVFVREGEGKRYVAQTAAIWGDFGWATPMQRIYHEYEDASNY